MYCLTHSSAAEKSDLLLPGPEHHIRIPGITQSREEKIARNPFPFLKLDIISSDDMGQRCFSFIDRKESSGAVNEH